MNSERKVPEEFSAFEKLTQGLIRVPKASLDEHVARYESEKTARKKKAKKHR